MRLDADTVLHALRALRVPYAADLTVSDGRWVATCPVCHARGSLAISELRPRDDDERWPPVTIGCRQRCAEPAVLVALLATNPDLLAARADAQSWRGLAERTTDRYRRHLELDVLRVDEHDRDLRLAA